MTVMTEELFMSLHVDKRQLLSDESYKVRKGLHHLSITNSKTYTDIHVFVLPLARSTCTDQGSRFKHMNESGFSLAFFKGHCTLWGPALMCPLVSPQNQHIFNSHLNYLRHYSHMQQLLSTVTTLR